MCTPCPRACHEHALSGAFRLLLCPPSARAGFREDLVSGISQDTIEITSSYTGTDIVVFGAIEQAQNPQGRNIVVVVRGPDEPMTVRRRDRIAGVWVNSDAARLEGLPAYYYLASTEPVARIAPPAALARYGIGLQALIPSAIGSHHDPEPFRQAAIRYHQRMGLYAESPGSIDFLSETLFRTRVPVPGVAAANMSRSICSAMYGERQSPFCHSSGWSGGCSTWHDAPFF